MFGLSCAEGDAGTGLGHRLIHGPGPSSGHDPLPLSHPHFPSSPLLHEQAAGIAKNMGAPDPKILSGHLTQIHTCSSQKPDE